LHPFSAVILTKSSYVPWNEQKIEQWEDTLAEMAELYEKCASRDQPILIPLFDEKLATWAFGGYRTCTACPAREYTFSVTPDGQLYRCRAFTTDYPGANPPFGDVWNGPRHAEEELLRAGNPRDDRCKKCEFASRCVYWCRCANFFTSGDPERPGELICRTQKATAHLADHIGAKLIRMNRVAGS
jgi:radical SAM protein with 4Fe4S-binding SPASM domain